MRVLPLTVFGYFLAVGLGGGYVKHTALANVRQLSLLLAKKGRADVDIVGVGGVATGRDAFEMILCGAKVGGGTPFLSATILSLP